MNWQRSLRLRAGAGELRRRRIRAGNAGGHQGCGGDQGGGAVFHLSRTLRNQHVAGFSDPGGAARSLSGSPDRCVPCAYTRREGRPRHHVGHRRQSRSRHHQGHRAVLRGAAAGKGPRRGSRGHRRRQGSVRQGRARSRHPGLRHVPWTQTRKGQSIFPRLAGQHAAYVVKQLNYIQSLVRAAPVMHGIVKDLTPAEIQAVAFYVQSK